MNTGLPAEVVNVLHVAMIDLTAHPRTELVLPRRKSIWAALGPGATSEDNRAIMTPGLQRRTALAIITAEHVLPIWERHWPSNGPHRMLQVAREYMHGEVSWDDAWELQNDFSGGLENAYTDDIPKDVFHSIYVGHAAVDAVLIALKDMDYEPDETLDEDLDMWVWDGSFFACGAYAGDLPWEPKSDRSRRREFWEWYLDKAVPKAYLSVEDQSGA